MLILAVAAASAGCGGSGGATTTSSMTKDQFAAKITEICAKGNKKIAKIGFALGSAGSVANSGQAVADVESGLIDEFKSIQPPDEIESQVDDFISKAETSRDKLTELVHVAKNFDAENVAKLTPGVASAEQDVHTAAKSFGATC